MPYVKKLPDEPVLRELVRDGKSNREIGDIYGTSDEAVRLRLHEYHIVRPTTANRTSHSRFIPWRVQANHVDDVIMKRLRAYSKKQQGKTLSPSQERLLTSWIEFMDGGNPWGVPLSVHYNRHDPEGFWLEVRRPGDRDYIHFPQGEGA